MSSRAPVASWPAGLADSPAAAVIERAIAGGRLGHSLLLHGEDLEVLTGVAEAIADRLLRSGAEPGRPALAPSSHPDCFALRPSGKMRIISADATRGLIGKLQVTPSLAACKVAIVHEADRMNAVAANIFLKTLEEPPGRTMLLLLTTHPYTLLPTIRSRCLHFKFSPIGGDRPIAALSPSEQAWKAWLADYAAWLGRLVLGAPDKRTATDHVLSLYGLAARFGSVVEQGAALAWERQKSALPSDVEEDEQVAIEAGLAAALRARCFAEIEHATRAFARTRMAAGDPGATRAFAGATERLEHAARLLRLNLNESAALEAFLLTSLRLWGRR